MKELLLKIKNNQPNWFENFIFFIIVLSAILVGIETHYHIQNNYTFELIDKLILLIFGIEIAIKLYAESPTPLKYFKDSWNIFDFIIVILALIPYLFHLSSGTEHAIIAIRLLRIFRSFRLLRLVTHLKQLQILVEATLKSAKSISFVILMLSVIFFIYSVVGVNLYSNLNPDKYGDLYKTSTNIFSVLTGEFTIVENINEIDSNIASNKVKLPLNVLEKYYHVTMPIYLISFFFFGGLIVLNLFIGIIVSELEEAKNRVLIDESKNELIVHIESMESQLSSLQEALKNIKKNSL